MLQMLLVISHGKFLNLEYLFIELHPYYRSFAEYTGMVEIPETLPAPCLCYLMMMAFSTPVEHPSFTTMKNLVSLSLDFDTLWFHFHPNAFLRRLPFLPQSETPGNTFNPCSPWDHRRYRETIVAHTIHENASQLSCATLGSKVPMLTSKHIVIGPPSVSLICFTSISSIS